MRMWMIPVSKLCDRHLLGEHVEIHMLVGCIKRKMNIAGYLTDKLVFPSKIQQRHKQIAAEMKKRGFNHKSELPEYTLSRKYLKENQPDLKHNKQDLASRCQACRKRLLKRTK